MADLQPYMLTRNSGIKLDVSCVKSRKGHEGEALFTCKIKFKNKHIADYEDLDWGNGDFADITVVNQELYDEAIALLDALPTYKHSQLKGKDTKIDLMGWANAACVYKDIEKQAKRERPLAYYNETDNSIRVFKKSKQHSVEIIQKHMETMSNIVPFHKLEQDKVTEYYLKEFRCAI